MIGRALIAGDLLTTLSAQTANLVLAGPTTGAATVPTFRELGFADIPSSSNPGATAAVLASAPTTGLLTLAGLVVGALVPFYSAPITVGRDSVYTSEASAGLIVANATTTTKVLAIGYDAQAGVDAAYLQSIYSGSATKPLLLNPNGGAIAIGLSAATARLQLPAGTTTAGTAPLKLTSGVLNTTPEPGAIEYDGTHFYGTDSGGTRRQLDN